jgi:hypothetical protein
MLTVGHAPTKNGEPFMLPCLKKNWVGNPSVSLPPIIHLQRLENENVNDGKI